MFAMHFGLFGTMSIAQANGSRRAIARIVAIIWLVASSKCGQ